MDPLKPTPLPGIAALKAELAEPLTKDQKFVDSQVSPPTENIQTIESFGPQHTAGGNVKEVNLDFRSTGTNPAVHSFGVQRGQGETVLVIDDQLSIRNVLQALLKTYGYNPLVAEDGPTGLACYRAHQKDIRAVIIDMRMPGMLGAVVIRVFRIINADIRIVAMSGYFTRQMDLCVDTERLIFLQKPMTGLELQSALQRVIRVPAP